MKKIIVFDLDGTLAESKQPLDDEMSDLLSKLLIVKEVAVISGGGFPQLEKQVVKRLTCGPELLKKLYIFPTKGAVLYKFDGSSWNKVYEHALTDAEKTAIKEAFEKAKTEVDFLPKETFGPQLEDRGCQFTFSALGQDAAPDIKKAWDPDVSKRKKIQEVLKRELSGFQIEIGGTTSIDITKEGIDKGFAILELSKYANTPVSEILFVGDALFPGGNDYPAIRSGADTIAVKDYHETKDIIRKIIEEKE